MFQLNCLEHHHGCQSVEVGPTGRGPQQQQEQQRGFSDSMHLMFSMYWRRVPCQLWLMCNSSNSKRQQQKRRLSWLLSRNREGGEGDKPFPANRLHGLGHDGIGVPAYRIKSWKGVGTLADSRAGEKLPLRVWGDACEVTILIRVFASTEAPHTRLSQ